MVKQVFVVHAFLLIYICFFGGLCNWILDQHELIIIVYKFSNKMQIQR